MPTIQELLSAAVQAHQDGQTARAAKLYGLILRFDPAHQDAVHLYGLTRRHSADHAAAALWMARGLRINATLAGRHAELGNSLCELTRFADAAAAYRGSLRRKPDQPDIVLSLAEALRRAGDSRAALAAYRQAVVLRPELAEGWYGMGVIAHGDTETLSDHSLRTAITQFRRAAALRRDHTLAWINRGIILYMVGDLEAAFAVFRQALSIDPGFGRGMMRMGQTLLGLGDPAGGRRLLDRAMAALPGDPETTLIRARAERYRHLTLWAGDSAIPAGLALRGTFRNTSGYAYAVRQFVRQLDAAGVPVNLLDVPVSFLKAMEGSKSDPFFERFDRPVRAKALLNFVIPNLAEPVPGLDSAVFSMSEVRTVPPDWLSYSLRHRHLIVPTPSSADAWTRAGFPVERVHLCPLGVDPRPLSNRIAPTAVTDMNGRRLSDYRTRFANVSDLTLRKNLDGLLRVWLRATGPGDDAALMLKLGKGGANEAAQIRGLLAAAERETGKPLSQAAPVFVMSGLYSDDEMTSLMAAATHYVSLSHGEGWDLPMTQAGAMGLTLIAPRHSAYTAYLDDEVALMLPARPSPGRAPYCGLEWWSPDENAAASIIARVIHEGLTPPRSARDRLARDFTWEQAGARLVEVMEGIGALG